MSEFVFDPNRLKNFTIGELMTIWDLLIHVRDNKPDIDVDYNEGLERLVLEIQSRKFEDLVDYFRNEEAYD